MSLGLGLFLSVLALIAAWQIDKRGAWRRAGKGLLWLLGVLILMGGATAGYIHWENSSEIRARAAIAEQLRSGEITTYWGIQLGASREDVLYLKGNPSERAERDGNSPAQWHYYDSSTPHRYSYTIIWDDKGKVEAIACSSDDSYFEDCEKIAGVGVNDLESHVDATLGEPTTPAFIDEKGYKVMDYGPNSNYLRLILNKQRVEIMILDREKRVAKN